MSQTHFHFKKFSIQQDKTTMKVNTDSVILGATADFSNSKTILDIGTGTGLLALIAAQKNPDSKIFAIDIDENSCLQAQENFEKSAWKENFEVKNSSLQEFSKENLFFDSIICNPPYFVNSLKSPNAKKNVARHSDSLPYNELIFCSSKLLTEKGKFFVMIPFFETENFINISEKNNLFAKNILKVRYSPQKNVYISILEFSKIKFETKIEILNIETENKGEYSQEYKHLTKDFYLFF